MTTSFFRENWRAGWGWLSGLLLLTGTAHAAPRTVTYHQDVQPVLARHCQSCHAPGEIGPMTLGTYREARPWARAIREVVKLGTMPPWHADATVSKPFRNARLLSSQERATLTAWADTGAVEGTPAPTATAPDTKAAGWRLGAPDMVIRVPGYRVPAQGTLEYTFLVTPTSFPADRWIRAAEWRIDQRAVVHHINAFVRPTGSSYVTAAKPGEPYVPTKAERAVRHPDEREVDRRELLLGYEPGYTPEPWGEGHAKLLRRGSDIVFEMHYTANGKAVTDYSELGIYFAQSPPRQRVLTLNPADSKLTIPPGAESHRSQASATLTQPVRLVSLQPHMHLRGKAYEITAVYPDGRRDLLLKVPRYDFRWQTTYHLADPLNLPVGTRLECVAWFDNSANNKFNPDPKAEVRWGDQSWEEMNIGFMEVALDAGRDPDVAVFSDTTRPGTVEKPNR